MLSVCTREFLSHPIEDEKHSLIQHLLEIGKTAEEIFSQTNFTNTSLAFYSGLLHDIGKINPIYQEEFHEIKNRKQVEEKMLEKYVKEHSRFSARAADILLQKSGLDYNTIEKIMVLIYGHHTRIRKTLGKISKGDKFISTQNAIASALSNFSTQISRNLEFSKLDWNSCSEKFSRPMDFEVDLESKNSPDDYLEMSFAFSCLLQADRGSFGRWAVPNFDLELQTQSLISDSPLGKIRTEFQEQVMNNFDKTQGISIINAPTGIGKTKVFLDIINQYSKNKDVERIFYFSPLLALTEDFEAKIASVISKNQQEDILIYNHLYSDSLQNKREEGETRISNKWIFENESFNKKFVITTTQRLLMTIYSNKHVDKMKMASFRNSVLIIDEVQTIPKPILSNLKEIFKKMNQYMKTRFILVSATIPHEISDIKRIELSSETLTDYLSQTKKQILIQPLVIQSIPIKKTLVMANTRKKAVRLYRQIKQIHQDKKIIYISAGIRKKDRIRIIKELSEMSEYVLVATQVVESGVDISFSHMYREQAPLDNLIQVMGRLNREGKDPDAKLVIYPTDGNPVPYSPLEFQVTQEKIAYIDNSVQIYDILEQYYSEISERNRRNSEAAEELERKIARMDFDGVWKFVKNMAFQEDCRDTVFIPDIEDWDEVKKGLLDGMHRERSKRNFVSNHAVKKGLLDVMSRKSFKKFGNLTASLPIPPDRVGLELFDEELIEENILLPKKEHLGTIYDENMGLDRWLVE